MSTSHAPPAEPTAHVPGTRHLGTIGERLRAQLRSSVRWRWLRECSREGWRNAIYRHRMQSRILDTPPLRTASTGPIEVRALTWRRDWKNLIWALKSYYHFSGVDYPLTIHDGGLLPGQAEVLARHFPDATIVGASDADAEVESRLHRAGWERCAAYRRKNPSTRKLFDFVLLSDAKYQVSIDSDIVFFRRPELLILPPDGVPVNRYNRDLAYWYSMSLDDLDKAFGIRPPPLVNSGLAIFQRESFNFDQVEDWLQDERLFADTWVTEQTIHALSSTLHGIELLPDTYQVDDKPGLVDGSICKHYPGFLRVWLYREGMRHLVETGFLSALRGRSAE